MMAELQNKKAIKATKPGSSAPNRLVLLILVVPKGKGTFFTDFLQETFGANMQIAIVGAGTARSDLVELLGLKDNKRSVVFSVVREDRVDQIFAALEERFHTLTRDTGIAFTGPLTSVIGKFAYAFLSDEQRMIKGE